MSDPEDTSSQAWPPMRWPDVPQRIEPPRPAQQWIMRVLILAALLLLTGFTAWLLQEEHRGDPWLYWTLTAGLGLTLLGWVFEWWYYWRMEAPDLRAPDRAYTVDIFTTACPGEPTGMILRTLEAMQRVRLPHTSYLCDEGNDPVLREACRRLGVVHVTREKKLHAKAGNINNALGQSSGEICIILDPDHEPAPFMIERVLGYFDDAKVGFVQSIQAYRNQHASLIAHGAAQMQYHFYGPIQMGMHGAGTPQAIGANCAFRREALESIGGHAAGLAEDMHTTMRLYAKGWKGVYIPEVLTRGLVPQTLGAFYKQQLKWSCGVFDLFFQVYPKVFASLNAAQRLHFFLCPSFFLRGWIATASILVPVLCLFFGGIAWKIPLGPFLLLSLPLLALVFLIRMTAQRYLLERSERGLHLTSGILSNGTWWIFNLGNLCALFRHKIPYVPTPKDDVPEDAWKLAMPNLLVAGFCLAAIPYGLLRDYSPFNLLMSVFAGWNAISLIAVAALGQQKTSACIRSSFFNRFGRFIPANRILVPVLSRARSIYHGILAVCRRRPGLIAAIVLLATVGTGYVAEHHKEGNYAMAWAHLVKENKEHGGFYTGLYLPRGIDELDTLPGSVAGAETVLGREFDITSLYLAWGPESLSRFPAEALRSIIAAGGMPMITWEPWSSTFPWTHEQGLDLAENRGVFRAIANGAFDYYVTDFADKLRELDGPVFLRFGHEMDNPQYPWSTVGGNTPDEFIAAWRHVVSLFHQRGASNVVFVYNPWRGEAVDRYYPGDDYVDWIGITLLNYGRAGRDAKWHGFDALYQEFHPHLKNYNKPVMLAEFGTTSYGGDPAAWLADAMVTMKTKYPQIQSAVLFHSDRDKNWATDWRPETGAKGIDWSVLQRSEAVLALREGFNQWELPLRRLARKAPHDAVARTPMPRARQLVGGPGAYELLVDGAPFFIRGVAYNPGHDWRDGGLVLTRRQLEKDFDRIKAMGANTVRRYSGGWADYNLFNVAAEKDLKVLYGLWLKQDIDYYSDTDLLDEMEEEFVALVEAERDQGALLAWVIGNETWGMFKHSYDQPYLTDVRHAYVRFVERIARRIKELDPDRLVLVACEHSEELPGALRDYASLAPSVDAIGVNSYYEPHLRQLPQLVAEFAPGKPYLVSEFGPDGYWHPNYTPQTAEGMLDEPSAREKAEMYATRWTRYVEAMRGNTLGGVAYCWSERYEGSATWFGLVDRKGRAKPAYDALREVWTGRKPADVSPSIESLYASTRKAVPNERIRVETRVSPRGESPVGLHWKVLDSNYEEAGASVERLSSSGETVDVKLPGDPGIYWIHLSAINKKGKLDQKPLMVEVGSPDARPGIVSVGRVIPVK